MSEARWANVVIGEDQRKQRLASGGSDLFKACIGHKLSDCDDLAWTESLRIQRLPFGCKISSSDE